MGQFVQALGQLRQLFASQRFFRHKLRTKNHYTLLNFVFSALGQRSRAHRKDRGAEPQFNLGGEKC
jgi:hypothetical protein